MGSTLQNWITPLVEAELTAAFDSLEHSYVPSRNFQKDNRCCESGTVETRFTKGKLIQIIDFYGRAGNSPLQATVSDGVTRICASFDQEATELFTQEDGRPLHEVKGGILAITDYKLDVLGNARIRPVMGKLEELFSRTQIATQLQQSSPIRSQNSVGSDVSNPTLSNVTQGDFATQVPKSMQRRIHNQPLELGSKDAEHALFAMLVGTVSKTGIRTSAPANVHKSVLQPVSEGRKVEMTSKLEAKANGRRSQSLTPMRLSKNSSDSIISVSLGKDLDNAQTNVTLDDSEKENSQESAKGQKASNKLFEAINAEPVEVSQEVEVPPIVDQLQHNNPLEGLKRVPRRYVRIPEAQKALLERKDSWYEPHSDNRIRYAAIPAKVIDDLTKFMDRELVLLRTQDDKSDSSSSEPEEAADQELVSDEDPGSDGDEQIVDLEGRIEESHGNRTKLSSPSSLIAAGQFYSSGPEIVNAADDAGYETNDGECTSWDLTPEPEDHPPVDLVNNRTSERDSKVQHQPDGSIKSPRPLKPRQKRMPIDIPPSSPTWEDELELAVPYAVGDILEIEDTRIEDVPKTSQELPSTAARDPNFVQVKQTPLTKPRSGRSSHHQIEPRSTMNARYRASEDVSSSPVIPATFNDTMSSTKHVSSSREQETINNAINATPDSPDTQHMTTDFQSISEHATREGETRGEPIADHVLGGHITSPRSENRRSESMPLSSTCVRVASANLDIIDSKNVPALPSRPQASPPPFETCITAREVQQPGTIMEDAPAIPDSIKRPPDTAVVRSRGSRTKRLLINALGSEKDIQKERKQNDDPLKDIKQKARNYRRNFTPKEVLTKSASAITMELPSSPPAELLMGVKSPAGAFDTHQLLESRVLLSPSPEPPLEIKVPGKPLESAEVISSSPKNYFTPIHDEEVSGICVPREAIESQESLPCVNLRGSRDAQEQHPPQDDRVVNSHPSAFDKFVSLYPQYAGDEKCFIRALVCMEWMEGSKHGLHPFLCDDFIRVQPEYESITRGLPKKQRLTARQYYDKNIKRPLFQEQLIMPENFNASLASMKSAYVQTVRDAYNGPAPPPVPARVASRAQFFQSPIVYDVEGTRSEVASNLHEKVVVNIRREASLELCFAGVAARQNTRKPFFETPSQLHGVEQNDDFELPTGSPPSTAKRSDKMFKPAKRTLSWSYSSPIQSLNTPSPRTTCGPPKSMPAARNDQDLGSAGPKKRHHRNDQARQVTLPPALRRHTFKSPVAIRATTPATPASRDNDDFESTARPPSASALKAARLSPELHGYTEKWVAEQTSAEGPVVEDPHEAKMLIPLKRKEAEEHVAIHRKSGVLSSKAETPHISNRKSFGDFLARRKSGGGVSSKASTPYSTPRKSFCTRPKQAGRLKYSESRT